MTKLFNYLCVSHPDSIQNLNIKPTPERRNVFAEDIQDDLALTSYSSYRPQVRPALTRPRIRPRSIPRRLYMYVRFYTNSHTTSLWCWYDYQDLAL